MPYYNNPYHKITHYVQMAKFYYKKKFSDPVKVNKMINRILEKYRKELYKRLKKEIIAFNKTESIKKAKIKKSRRKSLYHNNKKYRDSVRQKAKGRYQKAKQSNPEAYREYEKLKKRDYRKRLKLKEAAAKEIKK